MSELPTTISDEQILERLKVAIKQSIEQHNFHQPEGTADLLVVILIGIALRKVSEEFPAQQEQIEAFCNTSAQVLIEYAKSILPES